MKKHIPSASSAQNLLSRGMVLIRRRDIKRIFSLAKKLGFLTELRGLGVLVHEGLMDGSKNLIPKGMVLIRKADLKRIYGLAERLGFLTRLKALGVMVHEGVYREYK